MRHSKQRAGFAALGATALLTALFSGASVAEEAGLALVGATIHTVSGEPIRQGTLLVEAGRIRAVGRSLAVPDGYRTLQLSPGDEVFPGMIDADSDLGRVEIGSVRGTVDISEVGEIHPGVRAEIALNADSLHIPVTRANGVLLSLAVPRGGLISGTSGLFKLEGWNWEEMVVKSPVALHIHWPRMKIDRREAKDASDAKSKKKSPAEQEKQRDKKLHTLKEAFADARAYVKARHASLPGVVHETNPAWEAMRPALDGRIPVIVHADQYAQIEAALAFAKEEKLRLVLASGRDVWRLADQLKKRGVPVILHGIHGMPARDWEPYDVTYTLASVLHEAGVEFCISNGGGSSNNRNLPYLAAKSAAFGLPLEEAVRSVTLYPARILGVSDRYGSIQPGKDATFVVADGHILDHRTNVKMAFISGRQQDLTSRHTELYQRYRARPGK